MAKKRKWLKRIGKAALAAGAAYAGSKFLASQKPGWGVKEGFTDMDKNVGKTTDWITKKKTILPQKKPDVPFNWNPFKKGFLGVIRFNLFKLSRKENLVPLGGINLSNLTKLKIVKSNSFALLSEIKKKPAKLFNRLF